MQSVMKGVKRCVGWLVGYLPILTLVPAVSVSCSGCIWLALPALAYQGYEYEHHSNTSSSPENASSSSNPDPTSRNNTSSDHSIE